MLVNESNSRQHLGEFDAERPEGRPRHGAAVSDHPHVLGRLDPGEFPRAQHQAVAAPSGALLSWVWPRGGDRPACFAFDREGVTDRFTVLGGKVFPQACPVSRLGSLVRTTISNHRCVQAVRAQFRPGHYSPVGRFEASKTCCAARVSEAYLAPDVSWGGFGVFSFRNRPKPAFWFQAALHLVFLQTIR